MSTIYLPEITRPIYLENCGQPELNLGIRAKFARVFFFLCLAFIGLVSAWDAWLVEANSEILNAERNPICEFLILMDPESKIYFFIAKGISSASVLAVLAGLYRFGYRYAMQVATAVALFQLGLLVHLYLSDSLCGGYPNFALLFRETKEHVFVLQFR